MDRPLRSFDWDLAQSFLAVLETGSLSGAARELESSQPTLGRQIAALEAQLGLTLFTRTGRQLIPTPSAFDLASKARAMREAAAGISLAAAGRSETLKGTVRITASEVMATYGLPKIISELLYQQPELEIELVASNTNENLLLREADIAVRMHQPVQADLIARKIGDVGLGLFAHRSYLDRYGHPGGPEDLAHHIFLGYDKSEMMIDGIKAFGVEANRHDFRIRTDHHVAYAEAVAAGVGIGAVAVFHMDDRAGVERILPELKIPPMPMWLAAHQELKTSALVRRVFDHLADALKVLCVQ